MTDVYAAAGALQAAFRTDPGRVRTNNEDVPLVDSDRGVFGVIDGVGGHAGGEVAAAIAYDVILQRLARPLGTPAERVREAIAIANNEIFRHAEESPDLRGMTCVVTLALVTDRMLTIGHVGDTRLYKLRADGLRKLTHDHSPIGEREDAREMSEGDAMRHPRRNEVFRDVGGEYRDKDARDFVDVIEEPMERDSAILLCSDGLTDMVPSAAVESIVRQHAGSPEQVAEALIAAANDAGGRDNVTVVYAEAPEFARAVRAGPAAGPRPAELRRERPNRAVRLGRWIVRSRTTWFAFGALAGVVAALALVWRVGGANAGAGRTLVVGTPPASEFVRIADAMAAARSGDVVRLEPGVYRESVALTGGVDLVARVPGTVTIARPLGVVGDVAAISAFGQASGRVSGLRIESTVDAPLDVAIRVGGQGRTFELIDVSGPMRAAIDILPGAGATIQGSLFSMSGPALTVGDHAQVMVNGSTFVRAGRPAEPAIALGTGAQAVLRRNVFAGFGGDVVTGVSPAERQQMLTGNFVVGPERPVAR